MRLVVADTGPINYLILIDAIAVLPELFERIFIPAAVQAELVDTEAPEQVRMWIRQSPAWLEVRPNPESNDSSLDERTANSVPASILRDARRFAPSSSG